MTLTPRDFLPSLGPLIVMSVFAFMLYAIQVPINVLVLVSIGLMYWPFYELVGLLVDQGIMALFRSQSRATWLKFRNSFFPLLVILVVVGLYLFSQWFWLVIFAQCLHLVGDPPSDDDQKEGCLVAVVTFAALLVVSLAIGFGAAVSLSEEFRFPNVSGDLRYLPGMLILGVGYYFLMAILALLKGPAMRYLETASPGDASPD